MAALLLPCAAQAADGAGFIDAYFVPSAKSEVTVPGFQTRDDAGKGAGIRGLIPVSEGLAFTGEYQGNDYDDSGLQTDQTRLGLGFTDETGGGLLVEYVRFDQEESTSDGFAAHWRWAGRPLDSMRLYGQVGYVEVENDIEASTGLEYLVGAASSFGGALGIFVDVRRTDLEGKDSGVAQESTDIRAGVRIDL